VEVVADDGDSGGNDRLAIDSDDDIALTAVVVDV